MAQFNKKVTLTKAKSFFPNQSHLEQSRSQAADDYVWKEDTRVPGTQFELGERPVQRNRQEDWNQVWQQAVEGEVDQIPADIRIRCYNQIRRIGMDHMVARPRPNISVKVFYGVSGSGKTFGAVQQLGDEYYDKLPTTKFWDGYKGEKKQQPQSNAAASGQQGQSGNTAQGGSSNSKPYEITYSQQPWAPLPPATGEPVRSTKVGKGKKQYTVYEDGAIFNHKGDFVDQVPLSMGQYQKIADIAFGEDSVAWLEELDHNKGIARGVPAGTVKPAPGYPTTPVTQPTSGGSSGSSSGASSSGASSSGTSSASSTSRNPTPYDPAKDKGKGPMYKGTGPNQHDELRKSRRMHGATSAQPAPAQPSKAPKTPSPPAPRPLKQSAKKSITAPKRKMDPKKRAD
ncbi:hypothetical protein MIR68_009856 [Amoeboaphelidium protococcarum]|nr:hypothetical protein MIR68_009856 [Amoeboaphelidium protococcarum]